MRLHLFDFDGTISNSDSMFEFFKMIYNRPNFYYLILKSFPFFIKYHMGIISKDNLLLEWLETFNKHKKKDDLADSFLQGRWYLKNTILKEKIE